MKPKYQHYKDAIIGYVVTVGKYSGNEDEPEVVGFHPITDSSIIPCAELTNFDTGARIPSLSHELQSCEKFVGILPALPDSFIHHVSIEKPYTGRIITLGNEYKGADNLDWDEMCEVKVERAIEEHEKSNKKK